MQTEQRTMRGAKPKTNLSLMIDCDLIDRIDKYVGIHGNRSSFIRELLQKAMEKLENDANNEAGQSVVPPSKRYG